MYLIEFSMGDWYDNSWIIEKWHVIIPDPFWRHKLRKLVPFIFISYGWYRIFRGEKESIKIIRGFSCYLVQNTWRIFGSVIVFLEVRGEFIPVENERLLAYPWQRNSLAEKLVEKLDGFFCFSDCCTSFLHSIFRILHSIFCSMHSIFCILYYAKNIL